MEIIQNPSHTSLLTQKVLRFFVFWTQGTQTNLCKRYKHRMHVLYGIVILINIFIPKHIYIYIYIYEHTHTLWMYNLEKERVPEQDRAATRIHLHLRS